MRILVTGASGLVGGAFSRLAALAGHDVAGLVGRFRGELPGVAHRLEANLAERAEVERALARTAPEAIVNAAAISEPAACEQDPAHVRRLNVELPGWLAAEAAQRGIRLLHLSSEQVFAGDRPPYRRTDPVAPINAYARQKVESEEIVHATAGALAVTVRAPLLAGNSPSGRRSLHERLLADWAAGKTPRLYVDEIRQVCHADNLARALLALLERPALHGIFHWAGAEPLSRYELGLRIRAHFGLDEGRAPLVAVRRADDPTAAALRQADLTLDLEPLTSELSVQPESFAAQLAQMAVPPALRGWLGQPA